MYISIEYIEVFHYYFFFIGILSFFTAFLSPVTSVYLVLFYVVHSIYSWMLTWYMHKRISSLLVINPIKYIFHHIILTITASAFVFVLYSFFLMDTVAFTMSIVQIDFYIFIIASCWLIIAKFRLLNRIFNIPEEITIEYPEPVAEGVEMKIVTKTVSLPKPERFGYRSHTKNRSKDMKNYQIEIYRSRIEKLSEELKRTKDEKTADFYKKRIKEYERKIKHLE